MKTLSKRMLDGLIENLNKLTDYGNPKDLLICLREWLILNIEVISNKPFSNFQYNRLLQLNIDEYPVEYSLLNGQEIKYFIRNITKYTFRDAGSISMLISEALESLLFLESDLDCLTCKRGGLLVWKNEVDENLIYECRWCGSIRYTKPCNEIKLVPATKVDLMREKLI